MRNNNQILHGDQTRCEERPPQMLTRDLFAVANLLANIVVWIRML